MKNNKHIVVSAIGLVLILGALYFLSPIVLQGIGNYLVYERPVDKADVIIVLSGDNGYRVEKASALYRKGVSAQLIMSGGGPFYGRYYPDLMADYAVKLKVPRTCIIQENNSLSTRENALMTYPIAQKLQARKILIVTSYFHTRRSFQIFSKVYRDPSFSLYIIGADDGVDYKTWWKHYEMAEMVLIEWAKIVLYLVK